MCYAKNTSYTLAAAETQEFHLNEKGRWCRAIEVQWAGPQYAKWRKTMLPDKRETERMLADGWADLENRDMVRQ